MVFCWHAYGTYTLNGLIFSSMNLTVHAIMYTFYTFTALGYRPTPYAMAITFMQLAQMVVGTAVTAYMCLHMWWIEPQPFYPLLFIPSEHWVRNSTWLNPASPVLRDPRSAACRVTAGGRRSGEA